MLSGLIGSILENNKLKFLIPNFIGSFIFYFSWPVFFDVASVFVNSSLVPIVIVIIGALFLALDVVISIRYLKHSGENTLWGLYFCFAIGIFYTSAFIGAMLFYMVPDFSSMYVLLFYLAGYVANLLLYLVFNFATDRDPMGPVIVVFVGLMVVFMAAAFIALFAFNYPGIPLPPVE